MLSNKNWCSSNKNITNKVILVSFYDNIYYNQNEVIYSYSKTEYTAKIFL